LPDLERRIGQTENQLCVLLGENRTPSTASIGRGRCPRPAAAAGRTASQLLERRPDVREAEEALHAAERRRWRREGSSLPDDLPHRACGIAQRTPRNLFKASTAEWSAAAGVVQPLLDSQRSIYQVQLANARTREALFQYEKAVQTAFQEVADCAAGLQVSTASSSANRLPRSKRCAR